MEVSCPYSYSPKKMSLDTGQTILIGEGHPTFISATIIDLAILGATVRISNFPIHI
jgi:hypothetical protein